MPIQFLEVSADLTNLSSTVSAITDIMVDVCTDVIGLMTNFPLNIFLGLSLIAAGVGLFRKLKRG